ncbi:MAG: hypothetical protein IJZ68_07510 [Bacteroidaceae bacterium]|nr:hypothetical protein [Bacteroidaceae bacterium]
MAIKKIPARFQRKENQELKRAVAEGLKKDAAAAQQRQQQKQNTPKQPKKEATELTPLMPKYYLTNNVIEVDGRKLHQIEAARDIPEIGVQEGDLGGFVESERNLSHKGTAWIFAGNVYENASVGDGATVRGEGVRVHGNAKLSGGFTAYDEVHLYGKFQGTGCGKAAGRVDACDNTIICGSGYATDSVIMRHYSKVGANARAAGTTILTGRAEFAGNFESFGGHYMQGVMGRSPADKGDRPERNTTPRDTGTR